MSDNIMDRILGYKMEVKGKDENGHWILGDRKPLKKTWRAKLELELNKQEKIMLLLIIIQMVAIPILAQGVVP